MARFLLFSCFAMKQFNERAERRSISTQGVQ
jgi:hypothetical protein